MAHDGSRSPPTAANAGTGRSPSAAPRRMSTVPKPWCLEAAWLTKKASLAPPSTPLKRLTRRAATARGGQSAPKTPSLTRRLPPPMIGGGWTSCRRSGPPQDIV